MLSPEFLPRISSHAAMSKETLPMIGRLLDHATVQSTARDADLDDRYVLDAAEKIGSAVHSMLRAHFMAKCGI